MTDLEQWLTYIEMMPVSGPHLQGWKPFWPTITTGGCGNCQYASIGGNLIRLQDCDTNIDLSDSPIDFNPEGWLWNG